MMIRRCHVFIVAALLVPAVACSRGPRIDTQQVAVKYVKGELPKEDPAAGLWDSAIEHPAKLMVQDVTEPRLIEPGVELVRVRALHNGEWAVFRLEWDDPTQDTVPSPNHGSDAAAIQFPAVAGADVPDAAMGQAGKGVRIWYWKSLWQDDAERAAAGKGDRVAALYPNAKIDHYPFEANPAARDEMARRYAPAAAAGNPTLARPNTGPVQVLTAEGFGTSTVAGNQPAAGRGSWKDGKWTATIARPLNAGAELGALEAGKRAYVAFAIWDGAKRHTGSRKMRSGWIPLLLEAQ